MSSAQAKTARQIAGARMCIGKGVAEGASWKEKISAGMHVLSALTDWALEGSIVTADSMRARGYGGARRTSFQIYRLTGRDIGLIAWMAVLAAGVIGAGGTGAAFTPVLRIDRPTWGLAAYCLFLLIPPAMQLKEAVQWHISEIHLLTFSPLYLFHNAKKGADIRLNQINFPFPEFHISLLFSHINKLMTAASLLSSCYIISMLILPVNMR